MVELRGAVVVVTGASSGLGRRFAVDMANAGAIVTGLARREPLLRGLAEQMRQASPDSGTVTCDVSDIDRFTETLGEIEHQRGRIDVLVNNAGIGEPWAESGRLEAVRTVMETNYFAAVAGMLTVLPGMLARRHGIVVNVSSDSGRAPSPHEAAYARRRRR